MENLDAKKCLKQKIKNASEESSKPLSKELTALLCVCIASLGFFSNGTFVGWSSHAIGSLPEMVTDQQQKQITSAIAFGAAISPLVIHKTWHIAGTRCCILIANLLMVMSWILSTFSDVYRSLLIGRGMAGIAIGAIHFLIPIYIDDISAVEQKSTYNCIIQMQFAFGILSQFVLGYFENYLLANIMPAIIPAALFAAFCFMPESPRFLCVRGRENESREIIGKFKNVDNHVEYDVQMWRSISTAGSLTAPFRSDIGPRDLIPVFGIVIFEQLIGAVSILFYMQKILNLTEGEFSPELTAICLLTIFALSVALPYLVDFRFTLKRSLIWCSICMAISLCVLGVYCHYQGSFGHATTEDIRQLPLFCLGAFFMFYAIGPYRLAGELANKVIPKYGYFTVRCLLTSISWAFIYGITRILSGLIDTIGVGWLFWFMAIMCILMAIFASLFVPNFKKLPSELKLVESSDSFSDA